MKPKDVVHPNRIRGKPGGWRPYDGGVGVDGRLTEDAQREVIAFSSRIGALDGDRHPVRILTVVEAQNDGARFELAFGHDRQDSFWVSAVRGRGA